MQFLDFMGPKKLLENCLILFRASTSDGVGTRLPTPIPKAHVSESR